MDDTSLSVSYLPLCIENDLLNLDTSFSDLLGGTSTSEESESSSFKSLGKREKARLVVDG
jgi:hypothetical protein